MQPFGVAHLDDDAGGECADAAEQIGGQARLIADDHLDRHCLADGAANRQHNRRQNAGFRRRDSRAEHTAFIRRAQRQ